MKNIVLSILLSLFFLNNSLIAQNLFDKIYGDSLRVLKERFYLSNLDVIYTEPIITYSRDIDNLVLLDSLAKIGLKGKLTLISKINTIKLEKLESIYLIRKHLSIPNSEYYLVLLKDGRFTDCLRVRAQVFGEGKTPKHFGYVHSFIGTYYIIVYSKLKTDQIVYYGIEDGKFVKRDEP